MGPSNNTWVTTMIPFPYEQWVNGTLASQSSYTQEIHFKVDTRQVPRLTSCGSEAGLQCPKKWGIFLLGLPQLKIGFGGGSMAQNWITAHLRKPHALANLRFTHSVLS